MYDFVAHVLRRYNEQTDWNPFNSYLYLTHSSQAVLDFAIPHGLSLSISASPSPPFFTTYRLRALPTLTGALGYVFASIEDNDGNPQSLNLGGGSRDIQFKQLVERFRIIDSPRKPLGKDDVWQGGRKVNKRDFLLYGCMHIPTARVDALVATRLSPTWQLLATAISTPPRNPLGLSPSHHLTSSSHATGDAPSAQPQQQSVAVGPPPGSTNLHFNLQHDTGRWFTEYSYSVDDGMLGFRVLHNLGYVDVPVSANASSIGGASSTTVGDSETIAGVALEEQDSRQRVEDEAGAEGTAGGGLQGRFSVGAELFFSPLEKSAGLSTGMRFTTLPETSLSTSAAASSSLMGNAASGLAANSVGTSDISLPSQPPTTITATLNPMMGHLSTAYAARMTRDIVACSRFDFNVYSYESELTMGAEYWLRRKAESTRQADDADDADDTTLTAQAFSSSIERQLSVREQSGLSLRETHAPQRKPIAAAVQGQTSEAMPSRSADWSLRERENAAILSPPATDTAAAASEADFSSISSSTSSSPFAGTLGVLKTRISTSGIAALLWEGKLRNCLVSFGIRGDLSSTDRMAGFGTGAPTPLLRGVGIDVIYFSQNGE